MDIFSQQRKSKNARREKPDLLDDQELLDSPRDMLIEEHSGCLLRWSGLEHEPYKISARKLAIIGLLILAIAGYFLYKNSPIAAITFILIGVVGYLHLQQEPRNLDFMITSQGLAAGNELYDFDNIRSFWIFYDPPAIKILSLKLKSGIISTIQIPLHDEDPVEVRHILLDFIPETKHEFSFADTLDRLLRR